MIIFRNSFFPKLMKYDTGITLETALLRFIANVKLDLNRDVPKFCHVCCRLQLCVQFVVLHKADADFGC